MAGRWWRALGPLYPPTNHSADLINESRPDLISVDRDVLPLHGQPYLVAQQVHFYVQLCQGCLFVMSQVRGDDQLHYVSHAVVDTLGKDVTLMLRKLQQSCMAVLHDIKKLFQDR